MLSTAAFNALLKTLEEPPTHVVFVLATTHPHKVPETIQSRCQRFDFRRISIDDIAGRLRVIADGEGFDVPDAALTLMARHAAGGMRDAITTLEQLASFTGGSITSSTTIRNGTRFCAVDVRTASVRSVTCVDGVAADAEGNHRQRLSRHSRSKRSTGIGSMASSSLLLRACTSTARHRLVTRFS